MKTLSKIQVKLINQKERLPASLIGRYLLIYSNPKTGKSTFAEALVKRFGGTILDYDRNRVAKEIVGPVVVVDTLTSLSTTVLDKTLAKQGVEVLGDVSWGRGKQYFAKAVRAVLGNFMDPDWLTIVLAHKFPGQEMTLPYLPTGFEEYILVKTDATILYKKDTGGKRKFVFTSNSPTVEAGCRDNLFAEAEVTVQGMDGDSAVEAFLSAVAE